MPQNLDPRLLMQAAMQGSGGGGGAAVGAAQAAQPAPNVQASGPSQAQTPALPATAVSGLPQAQNTGGMSNVDLSTLMGSGQELGQDPDAFTQMVQILQDPSTPPDQKAAIQARLQLAAMRSLAGPAAQGGPSS